MGQTLRSAEEFEKAYSSLSVAEHARLGAVARMLQGGSGLSRDDLIQEAVTRAMEERRHWNADVDVVKFLIETMRSIAYSARRSASRSSQVAYEEPGSANIGGWSNTAGVLIEVSTRALSPEDERIREEEEEAQRANLRSHRDILLSCFDGDADAQLLVLGMLDGLKGEKLKTSLGMDDKEFASKYKKVSRGIDALQRRRA